MTGSNKAAGAGRAPAAGDGRAATRFPCDVAASCQPPSAWKGGGRQWPARVRDVSTGGLCLVLGRRFEPGAGLAIEVPGDAGSSSTLLAKVIHVHSDAPGSWALGCSLVSPLSDEELQSLAGPVMAQEAQPAAAATAPAYLSDVIFRGALPNGAVVERLIRKLYVKRPWPLAPGGTIGVRFRAFSGGSVVRVRVDACRSAGDRRVLECTFMDQAPTVLRP